MTKKTSKKASLDGLSPEARALHVRLAREWKIKDAAGGIALLTMCQCLDRLREAQQVLARDGIVTQDRFGCPRIHPATQIEREARAGLLACLKGLNLDLESLEETDAA